MGYVKTTHITGSLGYTNVTCDSCGDPLKPVFESDVDVNGVWESLQADEALRVHIGGGYGMFIDPVEPLITGDGPEPLDFLICHKCAIDFTVKNPWLARSIKHYIDGHVGHTCDFDGEFVWASYFECMRSKTHGSDYPQVRHDEDES